MSRTRTTVPQLTPWGQALETLRTRWRAERNTIGELCRRAGMERPEYYRICYQSTFGPSVRKLERLLHAMGYSWRDWAEVYGQTPPKTPPPAVRRHR